MCFNLILLFLFCYMSVAKRVTPNWWTKSAGLKLDDNAMLNDLLSGEGRKKFVVIDFYMENCWDCEVFQPEWNNAVNELYSKFDGEVIFTLVEGKKNYETISRNYDIREFPTLLVIGPRTYGTVYQKYSSTSQLTAAGIERWLNSYMTRYKRENPDMFEDEESKADTESSENSKTSTK